MAAKEYTASAYEVLIDYGADPIPTIYKDSTGEPIYVTDRIITGLGQLETIVLSHGMQPKGALIYNTYLNDNELDL